LNRPRTYTDSRWTVFRVKERPRKGHRVEPSPTPTESVSYSDYEKSRDSPNFEIYYAYTYILLSVHRRFICKSFLGRARTAV